MDKPRVDAAQGRPEIATALKGILCFVFGEISLERGAADLRPPRFQRPRRMDGGQNKGSRIVPGGGGGSDDSRDVGSDAVEQQASAGEDERPDDVDVEAQDASQVASGREAAARRRPVLDEASLDVERRRATEND